MKETAGLKTSLTHSRQPEEECKDALSFLLHPHNMPGNLSAALDAHGLVKKRGHTN